jgi:hypothetical protein
MILKTATQPRNDPHPQNFPIVENTAPDRLPAARRNLTRNRMYPRRQPPRKLQPRKPHQNLPLNLRRVIIYIQHKRSYNKNKKGKAARYPAGPSLRMTNGILHGYETLSKKNK